MPIALAMPMDDGTITASSASAPLPASNLLTPRPSDCWRTLTTQAYLERDLGSAALVRLVWLGYTNATSAATWRVRAADTQGDLTAAPLYDSGTLLHWPTPALADWERTHAFLWLPGSITCRWWRIDIDNVGSGDGYYQAGRLYTADPWVPPYGMDFGHQQRRADPSPRRRSNSGALYTVVRQGWREFELSVSHLDRDALLKEADRIDRLRGAHSDVLLMLDVGEPRYYMEQSIYGVMESLGPVVNRGKASLRNLGLQPTYSKRFSLEEMEHP